MREIKTGTRRTSLIMQTIETNWDDYSGLENIQNVLLLCHFAICFAAFLTIQNEKIIKQYI